VESVGRSCEKQRGNDVCGHKIEVGRSVFRRVREKRALDQWAWRSDFLQFFTIFCSIFAFLTKRLKNEKNTQKKLPPDISKISDPQRPNCNNSSIKKLNSRKMHCAGRVCMKNAIFSRPCPSLQSSNLGKFLLELINIFPIF